MKKIICIILVLISTVLFAEERESFVISDITKWNHPTKKVFIDNGFKVEKVELINEKKFPIFYIKAENKEAEYIYNEEFIKEVAKANGYWSFKIVEGEKFADVTINKEKRIDNIETDKEKYQFFYDGNIEFTAKKISRVNIKVEPKKDPEDKVEMYKELAKFFKSIPARDVKDMKLKQVKKYDKYKTKTANFYEYIFHTLNDDGSEMSVEIKKDFNRNRKIAAKIKKFADEFIQSVFEINTDSEVIFENEKTVILRDYVNITRTGVMKPIGYAGVAFITEIDKKSNEITAVNMEEGTTVDKGEYLTWEYEELLEEYSKNNTILYREEEFNYEKFLDAFIIKLEKTKEKIVGILFFGAITKSEDGKYNFYYIDTDNEGSNIEFKKTMSSYDKILYYKIMDKKSPSQSNYSMIFYKKGKGLEFMDMPDGKISLTIKNGEIRDGINVNDNLIIIPVSGGKFGVFDYSGNNILNETYDSIERIKFNDSRIFKVKNGNKTEYIYINENENEYWQTESYDIYKSEKTLNEAEMEKYADKTQEDGLTILN